MVLARIVGVYDADGTPWGELTYFLGARLGRRHCALCDITHGRVRERSEWQRCAAALPVPFEAFHRNDVPAGIAAGVSVPPPYVAAEAEDGKVTLLLDGGDLESCAGSPEALAEAIRGRLPAGDASEKRGVADGQS